MAYRPKIGLTMRLDHETDRFYLGRDYSEALEAAGAVPVHLPLIPDPAYIGSALSLLDGVLLPGADCDVDPAYYGEDPHPRLKKVVPEKDRTDLLVISEAERSRLPILAICYGMQVLNVARGGSLIQDIESHVTDCVKHEQGRPLDRNSHSIRIAAECRIGGLVRRHNGAENVKVNSHHHQSIRNIGENLLATAWANDGVVECIEDRRPDRYAIGVQWHPEMNWRDDEFSRSIFTDFVRAAAERNESSQEKL